MKVSYFLVIDVYNQWKKLMKGDLTFSDMSNIFADKLKNISLYNNKNISVLDRDEMVFIRSSLIDQFTDLGNQKSASLEEFDEVMEKFYAWANYTYKFSIVNNISYKICNVLI